MFTGQGVMGDGKKLSAIVLAAGLGSRLGGECKPLKEWQGKPLICHCLDVIQKQNMFQIIVVAGRHADGISSGIESYDTVVTVNSNPEKGMSSSIIKGIEAVSIESDGAFICLADMPLIPGQVFDYLSSAFYASKNKSIFIPEYLGKRGHPVLFGRIWFNALKRLRGDQGARELIADNRDHVQLIPVDDEGVIIDFDLTKDFERYSAV